MKNKEIEELLNEFKNADSQQFNELVEDFDNVYKLLSYIEQLEKDKKELKDGWQQEIYDKNKVLNDWLEDERKINVLENNRDKAIEMLTYKQNAFNTCFSVCDVIDILKGGSDE